MRTTNGNQPRPPAMRRQSQALAAALGLCLALATAGCTEAKPDEAVPAASGPNGDKDKTPPSSASVRLLVPRALTGIVQRWPARTLPTAGHRAVVAAPVTGCVAAVLVSPGDVVRAGAPMLRLVSPERAGHHATLHAASLQLEVVRKRLAVVQRLARDGLVEGGDRYALEREVAALEADAGRARAALAATLVADCRVGGDGEDQPNQGADVTLCAPIDGVVATVHARLGAQVGPNDEALVTLVSRGEARVELSRFEAQPGDATLTFVAGAVRLSLLTVARSLRIDDRDGATLAVHLPIDVTLVDADLRGEVEVRLAANDIFAVPRAAVAMREGSARIFRGDDDEKGMVVTIVGGNAGETWIRGDAVNVGLQLRAVAPGLPGGEEE